jgi:AAA15 family ATPase/GTPase
MKIKFQRLGALLQGEFELGKLTIICGKNNTGKTYATYALFGFLSFWYETFSIKISGNYVEELLSDGVTELNINEFVKNAPHILREACQSYSNFLPTVFASSAKHFSDSSFEMIIDNKDIRPALTYKRQIGSAKVQLFSIEKKENQDTITVSLLVEKDKVRISRDMIEKVVGDCIKDIVFGDIFSNPFIASAERTGAAIFRKELNLARNRLLENLSALDKKVNPFELMTKVYSDYALPVKTNVDFTRQLEDVSKKDSFIANQHPDILRDFHDIIGGEFTVTKDDELYFIPKGKRIKLSMDESSSAVRSLLDIGFYLRHVAKPGDLLMIDEPELNLHPENQRRVARLFARLVSIGTRVFITTHSDYIIKELNTLIMLNHDKPHLKKIAEKENYKPDELISADSVKVYIAELALMKPEGAKRRIRCQTLTKGDIDPEYGIEAKSFDSAIDDMNRIQEEIIWGESDD